MSAVIANGPQTSNQLARPLLPQVDSCTVIIFGASGDLSKRKLMSALFNLACGHVWRNLNSDPNQHR